MWLFTTTLSLHGACSTWVTPSSILCRGTSVRRTSPSMKQVLTRRKSNAMPFIRQNSICGGVCLWYTVKECASSSPTPYFWFRKALNITNSIEDSGEFNPIMTGCLLAAWAIVSLAMIKGIKSSARVRESQPQRALDGRKVWKGIWKAWKTVHLYYKHARLLISKSLKRHDWGCLHCTLRNVRKCSLGFKTWLWEANMKKEYEPLMDIICYNYHGLNSARLLQIMILPPPCCWA